MSAMLPARAKKIDITKLTDEEQKLFRLYGKIPTHKNVLQKMQKARSLFYQFVARPVANERKYFDSGDYALSKAGKTPQENVGTAIPQPENIPHASSPPSRELSLSVSPSSSISPVKESSSIAISAKE